MNRHTSGGVPWKQGERPVGAGAVWVHRLGLGPSGRGRMGCVVALVVLGAIAVYVVNHVRSTAAKAEMDRLVKELNSADTSVAERAAEALGKRGGKKAVAALVAAAGRVSQPLRVPIADALGKLGEADTAARLRTDAVNPLFDTLVAPLPITVRDGTPSLLRSLALESIVVMGDFRVDARGVLRELGEKGTRRRRRRKRAYKALLRIGSPAVGPLRRVLDKEDYNQRYAAGRILHQLGWKPDTMKNRVWCLLAAGEVAKVVALGKEAVPFVETVEDTPPDTNLLLEFRQGKWRWCVAHGSSMQEAATAALSKMDAE